MKTCPKIGDRVRFAGNYVTGPCVGTVEHVYKQRQYHEDKGDYWNAVHAPFLSQDQWHVRMRPDVKPERWPYGDSAVFAPEVRALQPER